MEIVKNGIDKVFYARCGNCASEIRYRLGDVETEKSIVWKNEIKYILCPVCNQPISANLLTEEEAKELAKNQSKFSYSCALG